MIDTVEVLAVAAHGGAIVIHGLGIVYNLMRSKRLDRDVVIHGVGLLYSAASLRKHARRLKR
jgi:hypothetical protein